MTKENIIVEPKKLWEYYHQHEKSLSKTMFEIAKNDQYGISVYLSENDSHRPCLIVEANEKEIYSENIVNDSDAEKTYIKICDKYLTEKVLDILDEIEESEESELIEQQDAIEYRESELDFAVMEFIDGILEDNTLIDNENFDEIVEDCKDHFLEYLARKHNLKIYRPMILEDEDGEDFYEEYPYDCMEFDDENNPVYK